MSIIILSIVSGILVAVITFSLLVKYKANKSDSEDYSLPNFLDRKKNNKYHRKGIYTQNFTSTDSKTDKVLKEYDVIVEIGERERTKSKSLIEVIGTFKTSITIDENTQMQLLQLIEGWSDSDSSEIEWVLPHPEDSRNGKIDDLLN